MDLLRNAKMSDLVKLNVIGIERFKSIRNPVLLLNFPLYSLLVVLEEAYGPASQSAKKTDFRKLVKDLSRVRRLLQQVS